MGRITLAGTYNVTSHYQTCAIAPGNSLCRIPGYETVNFNLNWDHIAGSSFDGAVFVTNVFQEKYYTFVSGLAGTGFEVRNLGDPSMAGVRLRYNFGAH